MRQLPMALLLIAVGLAAWVFELGAVLQGQAEVRNWSSTWVGLDLMEITGLVLTSILLRRRSVYLSPVAAVTATLFGLDAWFDVLTASAGAAWYESLAAAFFGEIPMTVLLAALAILSLHAVLERPAQPAGRPAGRPRTRVPGPDPGGQSRADPRGGEVRLHQGLRVLRLRHLVDPPGDHPGHRRAP
jgi:hypothetical protein